MILESLLKQLIIQVGYEIDLVGRKFESLIFDEADVKSDDD
jgi:hypothetical protein